MISPSRASGDVVIDGEPYTLARRGGRRDISTSESQEVNAVPLDAAADIAVTLRDQQAGMGYSAELVEGGYAYAENVDTRYRGGITPGPAVTKYTIDETGIDINELSPVMAVLDRSGDLLVVAKRYVLKRFGTTFVLEKDLGVGVIATDAINFRDVIVVGTGVLLLWTYSAGDGWLSSAHNLMNQGKAVHWVVDGIGNNYLVTSRTASLMHYIAPSSASLDEFVIADDIAAAIRDPAQWSASYTVGNKRWDVASIAATAHHVYFCKRNGVHDIDERAYSPNITPYMESQIDATNNGAVSWVHDDYLFVSNRLGLDRIDLRSSERQDIPQWVHPGAQGSSWGPIFGRVTAICSEGGWLIVAVHNPYNGRTYVLYGKDKRALSEEGVPQTGVGQMVWHGALLMLERENIDFLRVHGTVGEDPKLWVFSVRGVVGGNDGDGGAIGTIVIRSIALPLAPNPVAAFKNGAVPTDYRFATEGSLYTSDLTFGDESSVKQLYAVEVGADNLTAANTVQVWVSADGGAYALFGTATASPVTTLRFETSDLASIPEGRRLTLKLTLTGTSNDPPIVRYVKPMASVLQRSRMVRQYRIVLESYAQERTGGLGLDTPNRIRERLQALHRNGAVTLKEDGKSYIARVLPTYREEEAVDPVDRERSLVAVVQLAILREVA